MGCRGRGAQRPGGRRAKATLLCAKTKSSNVGDRGRTSPTRKKEGHSGASEDSGRSFSLTHTHTHTHSHTHLPRSKLQWYVSFCLVPRLHLTYIPT